MPFDSGVELRLRDGSVPLRERRLEIGRGQGARAGWLLLDDPTISSHHLTLQWDDSRERYRVVHLSRTNQTLLNGKPVETAWLSHGDELQLGSVTLQVSATDVARPAPVRLGRLAPADLAVALTQLSVMLESGLPLLRAMDVLATPSGVPGLSHRAQAMSERLLSGASLSAAMEAQAPLFTALDVGLVRSGEDAGKLPWALRLLGELRTRELARRRRIQAQLTYPLIVLAFSIVVVLVLGQQIMTALVPGLLSSGVPVPPVTLTLLEVCRVLGHPLTWILGVGTLLVGGRQMGVYLGTERGQAWRDRVLWSLPWIGRLVQRLAAARFCHVLAVLYRSGMPILRGLDVAAGACGSRVLAARIRTAAEAMHEGATLTGVLETCVPRTALSLIETGEASGTLETLLGRAAGLLEEEVETVLEAVVAALEPVTICIVGVLVGVIAIAGFAPIYQAMSHL